MKLRVIKKVPKQSYRGGVFYFLFFKDVETGKSYKTCISEEFRNYRWWQNIKQGDVVEINDNMVYGRLIDADTIPKVLQEEL